MGSTRRSALIDRQPTLSSELVVLSPLKPEHFRELYAVAADPLVWEQHPAKDRYKEAVFATFFQEALDSGGALIVADTDTNRIIGSSRFHGYDPLAREIEIGWTFLARSHWGGAYNWEMKQLMLQHAFEFVDRVCFLVGTQNFRSQRAVEKIGGVRVGSRLDDTGNESYLFHISATDRAKAGST